MNIETSYLRFLLFNWKFFHIQNKIKIAGKPHIVEKIKKLPQPKASTKYPDGDDKTALANPIIDDNKAYCVPVYFLLQVQINMPQMLQTLSHQQSFLLQLSKINN